MVVFIWFLFLMVSLTAVFKAAGWFAAGASRILGGATNSARAAISIAVALPEMALALAAVLAGRADLVAPIVIGSSIANILLVTGIGAVAAKGLPIKPDCAAIDAPLLIAALAIFYFSARDGQIVFFEGLLMVAAFAGYSAYVFFNRAGREFTPRDIIRPGFLSAAPRNLVEVVGARFARGFENADTKGFITALFMAFGGAVLLALAADIAIESLVGIAGKIIISAAALAMSVLSVAGAMPEFTSSLNIIRKRRYEVVLGNVFAGTTVNLLLVVGVAALFSPLPLGDEALNLGLPFLAVTAGLLTVSAFWRKINAGEGVLYLFLYFLFLAKLFNLF